MSVHEVDCETGEEVARELAVDELDAQAAVAASDRAADQLAATAATIEQRVRARIVDLRAARNAIAAGTATPQQQRDALVLALDTCERLARLIVGALDQAP